MLRSLHRRGFYIMKVLSSTILNISKLCSCDSDWSILLARLLKDSPNLREIEAYLIDDHPDRRVDLPNYWDSQLNCVPKCLLSSLETFKWTEMYGLQNQIDVAKYILRNALCLKTATILFPSSYAPETVDKMIFAYFRVSLICISSN